ncbi:MAG: hypothetical protein ACODAG_07655 [Myxococcota bacterium]
MNQPAICRRTVAWKPAFGFRHLDGGDPHGSPRSVGRITDAGACPSAPASPGRAVHELLLHPGEPLPRPRRPGFLGQGAAHRDIEGHQLGVTDALPEPLILGEQVLAEAQHERARQGEVGARHELEPRCR